MNGTPHLTADQLSTLAEKRQTGIPASEIFFDHLAECHFCRDALFLLTRPAQKRARFEGRWLAAAAVAALAVISPILLRRPAPHTQQASYIASAHRHLPQPFRRVALTPAMLRKSLPAPDADQFVVQTAAGERWISFKTITLFEE
ncbi:MAG TPA: hypothetical protein VKX25_06060 [Bryobacteraceae bacterium]|jgi:hypothetical protein|nr:hypothetical protein [Bryobacteraceae bacterium]